MTPAFSAATLYHAQNGPVGAIGQLLHMKGPPVGNTQRAKFQALCLALRPDLLRFAFWLSGDRALAEDVVQESLLRAWKAQESLQDAGAAKPWLLTIVRREYARTSIGSSCRVGLAAAPTGAVPVAGHSWCTGDPL